MCGVLDYWDRETNRTRVRLARYKIRAVNGFMRAHVKRPLHERKHHGAPTEDYVH